MPSDNKWRLYNLDDTTLPEQLFDLRAALSSVEGAIRPFSASANTPGGRTSPCPSPEPKSVRRFGLLGGSSGPLVSGVTAFSFGPPVTWGYFTVLFLTEAGEVFSLCPVCPFGEPCTDMIVDFLEIWDCVFTNSNYPHGSDSLLLCLLLYSGMRVPSSVLQGALEYSEPHHEGCVAVSPKGWLKAVFGVDALAENFAGKPQWIGES